MKKDTGKTDGPIFTVAGYEFGWEEIALAARAWGEWQPFFEQTRQALTCLRLATQTEQLPSASELRAAASAFRYAHNLISAEDATHWLARWQMTVEDWMDYLRAQLLRQRAAGRLPEIVAAHPVSDEAVTEVIKRYAVCADKLRDWAVKLAGQAAVAISSGGGDAGKRLSDHSPHELLAHIEFEFERRRQQTVTPKLIDNQIAAHRLEWIRFDCRYLWFSEKGIAREAAWCLSEDGLSLEEVAEDARGVVQHWNFYLDEIAAPIRPQFLAARAGDCLGPLCMLEGFPLFSIVTKTMPAANDPHIRGRAERAIVASFIEQAMNEHVRWAIGA